MLIFTLKKEWYEKIKSGEKTIEYREVKDYWTKRLEKPFGKLFSAWNGSLPSYPCEFDKGLFPCKFRLGYTDKYLTAYITKIQIVDGKDTDLKTDKKVYAIHFKLK
ncbi:hypothetical protein [Treponema pectinovorum]|uniref:hypothetical protein n=1 Tax=Treponema pectinovorum TaxID=164 RepID=UPI0011CBC977|nr:hypothetical protein [Treponema pectinovorum]